LHFYWVIMYACEINISPLTFLLVYQVLALYVTKCVDSEGYISCSVCPVSVVPVCLSVSPLCLLCSLMLLGIKQEV